MEKLGSLIDKLNKERHIGKSPLARSLSFFVIIAFILVIILQDRGVDVYQRLINAYSYYFVNSPHQVEKPAKVDDIINDAYSFPKLEATITPEKEDVDQKLINKQEASVIPSIALHTFDYSQYSQIHTDGDEKAELLSSLLMIELAQSDKLELLDRSLVSALFSEKSLILANQLQGTEQAELKKLPLSEYTLIGSLFSVAAGDSYSLKLVNNSTGKVIGASRFNFSMSSIQHTIEKSSLLVHQWLASTKSIEKHKVTLAQKKIAFGHFIDISDNDTQLNQGRYITDRLIEEFVTEDNYSVLSRTQMFPLFFEEYLRMFQFPDKSNESKRANTNYLIHGKYRVNDSNADHVLSIYLYFDLLEQGRELVVLNAENWEQAFLLIKSAIVDFLPNVNSDITAENIAESERLLIEAIAVRGQSSIKKLLSGKRGFSEFDIHSFSTTTDPKIIAPAKLLIQQSYTVNPDNQFAKLALAKIMSAEGETDSVDKMIREVLNSQTEIASAIAFKWLSNQRFKLRENISASEFYSLVDPDQAEQINLLLHKKKYLLGENYPRFNESRYAKQVFFRPETLSLESLSPDISIQIFEKLRYFYYSPGWQGNYIQKDKHNIEAVIHSDIARMASRVYITTKARLPSIDIYDDVRLESQIRRRSNLEIAVDGFSSSAFLDSSYLRSLIFLGHSLCQTGIDRCSAGQMINSWVVDNTKPKNIEGRGGWYVNVTPDIEKRDHLIFLAADVLDRVHEANFSEMFKDSLVSDAYFVKKYKIKLQVLIDKGRSDKSKEHAKRTVYAYRDLIRAHCIQLMEDPRGLSKPQNYVPSMESFAKLASKSEELALLRKSLLADIARQYPKVYPYLIINTYPIAPFIIQEQNEMIASVGSGKIEPIKKSKFMRLALGIFDKRIKFNKIKVAESYIPYFKDFYGLSGETAIDFAYLYHNIGDSVLSAKILASFGKNAFRIDNFDLPQVNGDYEHKGFDKQGQLVFSNTENSDIFITYNTRQVYDKDYSIIPYDVYNATKTNYSLGENTSKWRLHTREKYPYSGNQNPKRPEKFSFGNRGRLSGDMQWTPEISINLESKLAIKNKTVENASPDNVIPIGIEPFQPSRLKQSENNIERMFADGLRFENRRQEYRFDASQQFAIKDFSQKSAIGPLRESYFSAWFAKKRNINTVMEQLFDRGYLSVKGIPLFNNRRELRIQLKTDFSEYNYSERSNILKALDNAKKVNNAGYAEIYHRNGNSWSLALTLNPEDAIPNRKFGISVAITDKQALICSFQDGLYSFKKVGIEWIQQKRINARCNQVVMTNDWAAVSSREKVSIYKNTEGFWHKTQTLIPDKYLERKDQKHNFEYFGNALAIWNDTLVIGNRYGGDKRIGEVYIFSVKNNEWQQTEILAPNTSNSNFGSSVAVNENTLVVGESTNGDYKTPIWQSGLVFIYTKNNSLWRLTSKLVAKDRTKTRGFGNQVLLTRGKDPAVLILSRKNVFRYGL
ncbi:FG-GAP repeat protein [Colwellia sp. TT2012]|uniref:FG-GAP repeat protein n=1 Tax=Colwellia sp. TT2012 TaxID=1720342 RepID=UPI00070BC6F2|nr:FG-GAP repeat protein [Colwellia sp. TT2012]